MRTFPPRTLLATLLVLSGVGGPASAATYRVPEQFGTIQAAIAAAATGDTVLVAPGTYTGAGNREIQLLGKDLAVIGEAGSGSTVLDCQGAGRGFDVRAQESRAALIQGFTIRNGAALAPTWPGAFAGGVSCRGLSSPTLRDLVFENCAARRGGALGCADSSPLVLDCVFRGCTAVADGGAASLINFSYPEFEGCVFTGNAANLGGAVYVDRSAPVLRTTTVASNRATTSGGGVEVALDSELALERTLVSGNCAPLGPDAALTTATAVLTLECSALSEDGVDVGPGQLHDLGGRVTADPQICLLVVCGSAPHTEGDYGLSSESPCLPELSPCGQQIGALGESCAVPSGLPDVSDPETRSSSWGGIKSRFVRP